MARGWTRRRGPPRLATGTLPGSDVDSDGEAGRSAGSNSDSEPRKEVSEIRKMMRDLMEEMSRDRQERRSSDCDLSPRRESREVSSWRPGSSSTSGWGRLSAPTDMGARVDRAMEKLQQFEKNIAADRAGPGRRAVLD